jgi:hypothetical protein
VFKLVSAPAQLRARQFYAPTRLSRHLVFARMAFRQRGQRQPESDMGRYVKIRFMFSAPGKIEVRLWLSAFGVPQPPLDCISADEFMAVNHEPEKLLVHIEAVKRAEK